MALADVLEQYAQQRASKAPNLPAIDPRELPPTQAPTPVDSALLGRPRNSAGGSGLDSLLPLLAGLGSSQGRGSTPGAAQSYGGAPSHWESVADRMATRRYDYSPEDLNKMDYIISHESNWDPNAQNPSGAWGIPQILGHGLEIGSLDPKEQIKWFLNYVQDRYGGINAAYQHKTDSGWY